MMTIREIGRFFSEAREKKALSVEDVYRGSRIHPDVVRYIESGQFEKIHKPYLKSFLKKYAVFLELDADAIAQKYNTISESIPVQGFVVSRKEKKQTESVREKKEEKAKPKEKIWTNSGQKEKREKRKETVKKISAENFKKTVNIALAVIVAAAVFRGISLINLKKVSSPQTNKNAQVLTKGQDKQISLPGKEYQDIQATGTCELTLQARGEVWVQVTEGEKTLFAGIIKTGKSETWSSDGILTVWTGKADILDFFVNGHKIGAVAAGVVKHIKVSNLGIKIGDKWISYLE